MNSAQALRIIVLLPAMMLKFVLMGENANTAGMGIVGTIRIYNAAGAVVYEKLSQTIQNTSINLGEMPGIYFVQIETALGLLSKTIVVNK